MRNVKGPAGRSVMPAPWSPMLVPAYRLEGLLTKAQFSKCAMPVPLPISAKFLLLFQYNPTMLFTLISPLNWKSPSEY